MPLSLRSLRRRLFGRSKRLFFLPAVGPVFLRMTKYFPLRFGTVLLGVTYRCQCRCKHCGVSSLRRANADELSTGEMLGLLDELARMKASVGDVNFFGGEPLLRKDLCDLIRHASRVGLRPLLDTNGGLIDEPKADELVAAGLRWARVSIDSPRAEEHDANRGLAGLFHKAMRAARLLKERGVRVDLSTYFTAEKIDAGDIDRVKKLARDNGLDGIRLLPVICSGRLASMKPLSARHEKEIYASLEPDFAYYEAPLVDHPAHRFVCGAPLRVWYYVSPYGEVQPCCFVPVSFGSIREEPLQRILTRMWSHPRLHGDIHVCPMSLPETHTWIDGLPLETDRGHGPVRLQGGR